MKIRKTKPEDIDAVMTIYDIARDFMRTSGNETQWVDGYPSMELILSDIENGHSYVCIAPDSEIAGVFFFREGNDSTYDEIYGGQWLNDNPYGVVHRMAGNGKVKGIAAACLEWCCRQCGNIRVDTHEDNLIMQNIFIKNGFVRCGIIYIANGTPRIAYHKCIV